jgi:beta-glucosidase
MNLCKSEIRQLEQANGFFWASGIEDTFITAPHPGTGRHLDEYELTNHYQRWREDLLLFRELGLKSVRYGIPWHRVQPSPTEWNWEFVDQTLEFLLEQGITPIVDLVHYGLPAWMEDAYGNPAFPQHLEAYTAAVVDRFRGRIFSWTPLNEPRITGWYCGRIGWWPPGYRSWRGFAKLMLQIARGIVRSSRVIQAAHPENAVFHVDATDLYAAAAPDLQGEAELRQEIVFLALDLVSGRVGEHHPLYRWLLNLGSTPDELEWFRTQAIDLDVIGINLYPMFSSKLLSRSSGRLRLSMSYAGAEIIDRLAEMYHRRYDRPLFIAETASVGSVRRRLRWLDDSVAAVGRVRARGIPMLGYTWWPLFALVTWAYRQGKHPPEFYLRQMGLWDLTEDQAMNRIPTPLVDRYREWMARGPDGETFLEKGEQCSEASSLPDSNAPPVTTP